MPQASRLSISVVVPCFNQARFLAAALTSVLDQADGAVECIVVDDGSTDETSEVARRSGVTLLVQENRGLAAARNRGLEAAKGDVVVFLDADDRLTPSALATNAAVLARLPDAAFVSGCCTLTGPDGTPLYTPVQYVVEERHYEALLGGSYIWNPGSVMYRRAAIAEIGGFDTTVSPAADYRGYLRLARANRVVAHSGVTVEYRQHAGQMSQRSGQMLAAVDRILDDELERCRDEPVLQEAVERTRATYEIYYSEPLVTVARTLLRERLTRAEALPPDGDPVEHARVYADLADRHRAVLEAFSVCRSLALDRDRDGEHLERRRRTLWQEIAACS